MSITAECSVCGRKYQAPATLAGKRVRCKQCGNIFTLPETFENEGQADLEGLANLERSHHSMDATSAGEAPPEGEDSEDGDSPGALPTARMNVRFDFPYAKQIDHWAPLVLTLLGLLWLVTQGYQMQVSGDVVVKKWIAATRVGLALVAFALIILPITLAAIRAAGRQLDYRMPINDRFRALACFLPAFALTYVMWINGNGDLAPLILGGLAGVLLATGAVWLLFRLRPMEIAPTAGYAAVGYFTGIALTAALFVGFNQVALQTVLAMKRADLVPQSPFASSLAWIRPEQFAELRAKPSQPTTKTAPTTSVATNIPAVDSGLAIGSPVVRTAKAAPIAGEFDSVIFPLIDAPFVATVRNGPQVAVESWDAQTWKPVGTSGLFPPDSSLANRFALSPDGDRLALISRFPTLSAQIWSFKEKRMLPLLYLENRPNFSTNPDILGFTTPDRLLTRWQRPGGYAFEVIDVVKRQQVYRLEVPLYEAAGNAMTISSDGKLAAIATKIENKPTLILYDLVNGKQLPNRTEIASLDAQWPVTPTGMAFSNDGKKLAILFEQAGNGLLLNYEFDPASGSAHRTGEFVFPAGPLPGRELRQFTGNAIAWIPGDAAWMIYGQGLFSVTTGQYIADLAVPAVERYRISQPDIIQIVGPWPPSTRQISLLQLDLPQITSLATKK